MTQVPTLKIPLGNLTTEEVCRILAIVNRREKRKRESEETAEALIHIEDEKQGRRSDARQEKVERAGVYTEREEDQETAEGGEIKRTRKGDATDEYKTKKHFVKGKSLVPLLLKQSRICCDCDLVVYVGLKKDRSAYYVCCGKRNEKAFVPKAEMCGYISIIEKDALPDGFTYSCSQ